MDRNLFNVAYEHYKAQEYKEAYEIWEKMTDSPTALYNAASILLSRKYEIPNRISTALRLFQTSAKMGDASASYYSGYMFEKYYGEKYFSTAIDYYIEAVEGGEQSAFDAIKRMAEQGDAQAQAGLAYCYNHGFGTEMNDEEAEKWALLAFQGGERYMSGEMLAIACNRRKEYSKAFSYNKASANAGNHHRFGPLGDHYRKGVGTEINYPEALSWYAKGANAGHEDARYFLGYMHLKGMGCKKNKKEAIKHFEKVVEGKEADPICWVGDLYFLGNEGLKNRSYGLELLEKAATMGSSSAYARLGSSYYLGWHVVQDYNRAFEYLSKAPNHYLAQEYLGLCHYYGKGCKKDVEKAKLYFKLAIENGNANARQYLDSQYELTPASKWEIKKEGAEILGSFIATVFGAVISSIGDED